MNKEIYVQLRKHLDNQPAGLPETRSGAEIDILKCFYTPEQAKIALKMTNIPEPAVKIAKRLKIDEDKARESLEKMAKDGLLFRLRTHEAPLYMQPNFIMGIYEWHVNKIDREIGRKEPESTKIKNNGHLMTEAGDILFLKPINRINYGY